MKKEKTGYCGIIIAIITFSFGGGVSVLGVFFLSWRTSRLRQEYEMMDLLLPWLGHVPHITMGLLWISWPRRRKGGTGGCWCHDRISRLEIRPAAQSAWGQVIVKPGGRVGVSVYVCWDRQPITGTQLAVPPAQPRHWLVSAHLLGWYKLPSKSISQQVHG